MIERSPSRCPTWFSFASARRDGRACLTEGDEAKRKLSFFAFRAVHTWQAAEQEKRARSIRYFSSFLCGWAFVQWDLPGQDETRSSARNTETVEKTSPLRTEQPRRRPILTDEAAIYGQALREKDIPK